MPVVADRRLAGLIPDTETIHAELARIQQEERILRRLLRLSVARDHATRQAQGTARPDVREGASYAR